ncbi:MAG: secretin N-terminal domain-containing protein, partial [Thermoguttaceae bacterium]
MHNFHSWKKKSVAGLAVLFFGSACLAAHSVAPLPGTEAKSAKVPKATLVAGVISAPVSVLTHVPPVVAEEDASVPGVKSAGDEAAGPNPEPPRRPFGRLSGSGARILWVADPVPAKRSFEGKSPAPIVVMRGRNGLTISSEDLEALDEFERLLSAPGDGASEGHMSVFYLKHAKAQAAAQKLETLLAGGSADSDNSSNKGSRKLTTGSVKITPDTRLNALLVQANRTDKQTIKQLLNTLDMKESPEDIAVLPKPRLIPVAYARAKDIADVLRAVYADRLVLSQGQQNQQARAADMAMMMMRAMGGDGGSGDGGSGDGGSGDGGSGDGGSGDG